MTDKRRQKLNPLSYGMLALALMASALYAAVQSTLQETVDKKTVTTQQHNEDSEDKAAQSNQTNQNEAPVTEQKAEQTQKTDESLAATEQSSQKTQQQEQSEQTQAEQPKAPSQDRFIPTEDISEDLAVSFPVDI